MSVSVMREDSYNGKKSGLDVFKRQLLMVAAVEFTFDAAPVMVFRMDINLSALNTILMSFPVTVT